MPETTSDHCISESHVTLPRMSQGTLAAEQLRDLLASGSISADVALDDKQVQPASIDLRLSGEAYRMPGSMLALPGERVRDLIERLALERVSLDKANMLARGQVYLVRLTEAFNLPAQMEAYTNSKSSTGRIDLATRVIVDGSPRYDRIPAGYQGELWCELIPRSFDVIAHAGDSLNQAIFFTDRQVFDNNTLSQRYAAETLLFEENGKPIAASDCLRDGRLMMSADLSTNVVGWVAKRSHRPIDLQGLGQHNPDDYFTALPRPQSGYLFLERDRFYILATRERIAVPGDLACEMVPYDPSAGEFRAHYAGFFDPGWGIRDGKTVGYKAVLEVRPHEDDLILRHGQPICAMAFEKLVQPTAELYGGASSHYADQNGPRLSKHFCTD